MAQGSNLPLGFALFAVGAMAVTAGLSRSHSWTDVFAGSSTLGGRTVAPPSIPGGATSPGPSPGVGAGATTPGQGPTRQTNPTAATTLGQLGGGFVAQPGSNFSVGEEPQIASRLAALGRKLHATIFGISGYRSPSHSIAVGGFANDPHTQGKGADVGLNAPTRASFARVTDAQLASVGLYRPFGGANEINHVALMHR